MSKWTQQMPLLMEVQAITLDATATVKAIAVLGGTTSDVASKAFTKS